MDVFGVGFIVLACLVGGFIAVFADNLGRTLGKKRLTLLKMRPRKTAQVITFVAGAVIPLMTAGAIMWSSKAVRQWFSEGPGIIKIRDDLNNEVNGLKGEANDRKAEIERLDKDNAEKQKQAIVLQGQVKGYIARVKEYSSKLATLSGTLALMTKKVALLTSRFDRLTADYSRIQIQLANTKKELKSTDLLRKRTQQDYDTLNNQKQEIEKYNIQLQEENTRLEAEKKKLEDERSRIEGQLGALSEDLKAARSRFDVEIEKKQRELDLAAIDYDKIQGQLKRASLQAQAWGTIAFGSRRLPMMFRMGEEVARIQVSSSLSRQAANDSIIRLIRIAKAEAEKLGAKPAGTVPSAGIMDRYDPDTDLIVSGDEQRERIIGRITGVSEPMVLVATSSINAFLGEPVSIDIQSFRNPTVFNAGELIAETRIDGDKPEEVLVDQISDFVRNDVKKKAKDGGMVPVLGMEQGYGELPKNTLLSLMRTAKANNRRVRIQAFAPKDIRAGDPLVLDYRIR